MSFNKAEVFELVNELSLFRMFRQELSVWCTGVHAYRVWGMG